MTEKHTPTPWEWVDAYDHGEHKGNTNWDTENFKEGRIKLVSKITNEKVLSEWGSYADDGGVSVEKYDAAFIVRACNSHDALVNALSLIKVISDHGYKDDKLRADGARALLRIMKISDKALALAGVK